MAEVKEGEKIPWQGYSAAVPFVDFELVISPFPLSS